MFPSPFSYPPPNTRGFPAASRRSPLSVVVATLATTTALVSVVSGCGAPMGQHNGEASDDVTVSSPLIQEGESIPDRYTCHGTGISPPLQWSGLPSQTESIAVVVDDPQASGAPLVHWVVFGLEPENPELPEGNVPSAAREGTNSEGEIGYTPPCPEGTPTTPEADEAEGPDTEGGDDGATPDVEGATEEPDSDAHYYRFTVYALSSELDLPDGAPLDEALGGIAARTVAWGRLLATRE